VRIRGIAVHSFQALLEGALVSLIIVALVTGTALAARGGKIATGGYSVTVSPSAPYSFGQQVWVDTNTPVYPDNTGPWIWLKCYQGSTLVLTSDHAGFADGWYFEWPFTLGPTQSWSGGDADCTVTVVHTHRNKVVVDAKTTFHVAG
jgi:hypothetical protein